VKINLSLEEVSPGQAVDWLADRPGRTASTLFLSFILSLAGAVAYPGYKIPLASVAVGAMLGLLTLGVRTRDWHRKEGEEMHFTEVLDAFSDLREDADYYPRLSNILAESFAKFSGGQLEDRDESWKVRNSALEVFLELECRRLEHLGIEKVSLIVARATDDHYLIRRVCGPLKLKIAPGHKCPLHRDIDDSLHRLAPEAIHQRIPCFGEKFVIAMLAESSFPKSAQGELGRIATIYQLLYERFRLMESVPLRVTSSRGLRANAG
jgi:hypothetical protein